MNRTLLICIIFPALILAACQKTSQPDLTPPSTTSSAQPDRDTIHTLSFDGANRSYFVHLPPTYDSQKPVPLVLVFHGFGLDGQEMVRITGFNAQADASGFLVAYPTGSGRKPAWNGGGCCGEAAQQEVDDVGFVRLLIDEIAKSYAIDRKRVYATGFSNGAIFVYRLACELADQIAAIGPVSATPATQDLQACRPIRPVPILHFHGTADKANLYGGGTFPSGIAYASVQETIQFWAKFNQCPAQPQNTPAGKISHDVYSPCAGQTAVELYTIEGGEHAWPGGEPVSAEIGMPSIEILATPLLWGFFAGLSLP